MSDDPDWPDTKFKDHSKHPDSPETWPPPDPGVGAAKFPYPAPPGSSASLPYSVYSGEQRPLRAFDSTSSFNVHGVGDGAEFYETNDGLNLLSDSTTHLAAPSEAGTRERDEVDEDDDVGTRRSHRRHRRRRSKRRKSKPWYKEAPWWTWTVSAIQIVVFVVEFVKMGVLTGSPVQTKPSFNPMIGPSSYLLINMGGRFSPCMRPSDYAPDTVWPCPNSTSIDTDVCSLAELCGFGFNPEAPNQWWRFITAMFLHAGIIHIGFNLLLQIVLGGALERDIGIVKYMIVYWASGIGGFIMSGNYAGRGTVTVGASGALFGVIAIDLLDLLLNWQLYTRPLWNLLFIIIDIVISFVLGLLPGIDNFAHIGGFCVGILTGLILMRSPLSLRLKRPEDRRPHKKFDVVKLDMSKPLEHFKNRTVYWWLWWLVRLSAFATVIVYYVLLLRNFEENLDNCSWCKYLSCLPVNGWCDSGY